MEIGKIVRVGFGERQPRAGLSLFRAVLPRRIDALAMRDAGGAGGADGRRAPGMDGTR